MKKGKNARLAWVAALSPLAIQAAMAQNPATQLETPSVEVIGTTPIPGLGTPRDQVPSNVQAATDEDIEQQRPLDLSEFLFQNFPSLNINQAQNNPFQPDVTFRGFTASPLLGNPIGLSVYVDGVRVNESFGDTVFFDLIPMWAVSSINLIPGSNPVFGLNTLGGALALRTKSGFQHPDTEAEVYYGSFDRKYGQVSHGGYSGDVDYFFGASYFDENGWRDFSPTTVRQLFGKVGWENATSDLDLSYTYANNSLIGNGFVPESILDDDRDAVYTFPDETKPELHFVNLRASHFFTDTLLLAGNAYHRRNKISTFNGDAEFDDGDTPLDATDDEVEAENRQTQTDQKVTGLGLQLQFLANLANRPNQLTIGVTHDRGRTTFNQEEQEADFTPDRGTIGEGEFEVDTRVSAKNEYYGIYVTDTFSVTDKLHLTASARYNYADIEIRDKTGLEDDLDGDHSFNRINPAIGATYAFHPALTIYGNYNEGNRVPTPVELTCADPEDPCSLPVGFAADPPLDQVVAKTIEAGVRGRITNSINWNASLYRTELTDDILFIAVGGSQGFFTNVSETQRQGVELGLNGTAERFRWYANYSYTDATFESSEDLFNPVANPADPTQPATTPVSSGDQLPGIPEHLVKLGGDFFVTPAWSIGGNLIYTSSTFLRGDEDNNDPKLSGYTIVNLRTDYTFGKHWTVFAELDNIFDSEYETLGTFNRNAFDADSEPLEGQLGVIERFLGPGQPRAGWVGVRYSFEREKRK